MVEIYEDVAGHISEINRSIEEYGFAAEHNYHHYLYHQTNHFKTAFFGFGKRKGILAGYYPQSRVWHMISEVLAPPQERMDCFKQFLGCVFRQRRARRVSVEVSNEFRNEILRELNPNMYRVKRTYYSLYWPVYDVMKLDPQLPGKEWKKLRNIRNRFHGSHDIAIRRASDVPKDELHHLFKTWARRRFHQDDVDEPYYKKVINNEFAGFDIAQTILIDGVPSSLSAGWRIPNSNNFYYAIGLHNYAHSGLNELANFHDLLTAKEKGYAFVDLGGSDKNLLSSKKKFNPDWVYRSFVFSIVPR